MVSKFLGFSKPAYAGRTEVRGFVCFKDGHGFEPKFMQFFGEGVRFGVIPCDGCNVYWFLTFTPSSQGRSYDLSFIISDFVSSFIVCICYDHFCLKNSCHHLVIRSRDMKRSRFITNIAC